MATRGYKSSINLGLPSVPDPPDPAFFSEFTRLYNAIRNLSLALDAYTGALPQDAEFFSETPATQTILTQNTQRLYVLFSENASYGQTIHLWNDAGTLKARLANATAAGKPVRAWCSTTTGVISGQWGEVMLGGLCTAIGSLTPGQTYYAGNTAGAIAPTAGTISQKVGYAISPALFIFQPELI
jgi:hypothetical protein